MKNKLKTILILAITSLVFAGCSKTSPKVCGAKEVEQELIKKASEQGLIPKDLANKIQFSITKIEENIINPKSKDSEKEVVCAAQGKLEYIEEVQKAYTEIRKLVSESYPFANYYFSEEVISFKKISYKVKRNQLNDGVIVDGKWVDERSSSDADLENAEQLSESVLLTVEKRDKVLADLKDVAQMYNFMTYITDKSNDIARPGGQVREYILKNKIPILQCRFLKSRYDDFFDCRAAGDRASLNIYLFFEDFDQIIAEFFDGKKLSDGAIIRDERIDQLLAKAKSVQYEGDSFKVFNVTLFSKMEQITIK